MATYASKPGPVKQLKEHLRQQQEPFALSTCLSERRYSMKKLSPDGENTRGCSDSMVNLKEPCSSSLRKRGILHAPRNLKSLLYKFITPNDRQECTDCNKAVKEKLVSERIDMIQLIAETNWFSTVSNVTPCSASEESEYGASEHRNSLRQSEEEKVRKHCKSMNHDKWFCVRLLFKLRSLKMLTDSYKCRPAGELQGRRQAT